VIGPGPALKPIDANRLLRGVFWARLGVAGVLLPVGSLLPEEMMPGTNHAILAVSLALVVLSSVTLLLSLPTLRPRRLAWLISLLDVAIVTAVVASTGGARSMFTFLYVLLVTAACLTLSRTGGLTIAATASALYTALVFGGTVLTDLLEVPGETTALELLTMFSNAGTFLVVAIVAGGLAERFRSTRAELESQRKDLEDLQVFKNLVFESVGTGLIAIDRVHRITAFNRAASLITAVAAGDAIGRRWELVFADVVPLAEIEAAIDAEPGHTVRHEVPLRRPGAGEVPVRMMFSALNGADGSRLGLICACEDLSTLRAMEERLRQADRLATLGRMSANIAHEIRNPLASLTGAIEVLAGNAAAGELRERLAGIVLKESGRLNTILRDFLEYARPAPLSRARVNVCEIVDEVLVLLEHRAVPGTLKIRRELPASLEWDVDPQQLRQAIWNLCLNAMEAMPDGGELRVTAVATPEALHVDIADTGDGIPRAELHHVFEPFYSTKSGGTGLGLSLVHRIVQDHGGTVEVESTPGAGSTFSLRIPVRRG
jgi:two-component system sensor histidine kinase PilS (NtrC family)